MPQSMRSRGGSLFYKKPLPKKKEIRKKRWRILPIIFNALKRTCMVIGALVLFSSLLTVILVSGASKKVAAPLPNDMVLVLQFENGIAEKADEASFSDLFPVSRPTLAQVLTTIRKAAQDDRVKAIVYNPKSSGPNFAHIQEVRAALARFKETGKKVYFYTASFADIGGTDMYYLASIADEIWMQPIGMMSISPLAAEVPLAREAMNKIGVRPDFVQREEYKNLMESFSNSALTPETQEAMTAVLSSLGREIEKGIQESRPDALVGYRLALKKGLLDGDDAKRLGLIDHLDYGDVLISQLRKNLMGDPEDESLELTTFQRYASDKGAAVTAKGSQPTISGRNANVAMVPITGAIMPTEAGNGVAAADIISAAIMSAAKDKTVKAIILRVDSPGGSPSASETIRRAIIRAKEKGKYVVVSMGNVAASGGYWVATDADKIFANPSTLTGSIGVVMGKFEASSLWQNLGVNWALIAPNGQAPLWSVNRPFTPEQKAQMNRLIDSTYDEFLVRVAEGRGMDKAATRAIAKGRVWSGSDAKRVGLVDELGGLHEVKSHLAEKYGVSLDNLSITILPKPKSAVEQLIDILGVQASVAHSMARVAPYFDSVVQHFGVMQTVQDVHGPVTLDTQTGTMTLR